MIWNFLHRIVAIRRKQQRQPRTTDKCVERKCSVMIMMMVYVQTRMCMCVVASFLWKCSSINRNGVELTERFHIEHALRCRRTHFGRMCRFNFNCSDEFFVVTNQNECPAFLSSRGKQKLNFRSDDWLSANPLRTNRFDWKFKIILPLAFSLSWNWFQSNSLGPAPYWCGRNSFGSCTLFADDAKSKYCVWLSLCSSHIL